MIRTQIQLTETQSKKLREIANQKGISLSELIRQSVDNFLEGEGAHSDKMNRQRAKEIAGQFSGPHDLSINHDQYWE